MDLDKELDSLAKLRGDIAEDNALLAGRELDGRLLRAKIEGQLRRGDKDNVPRSKTDAEKEAKAHPDYIAFERETIRLERGREFLQARAEVKRLQIEREIALLKSVGA